MTPISSDLPEFSAADELMAALGRQLDSAGIGYAIIGGQAVIQHGYSRATLDIDVSLAADLSQITSIVNLAEQMGLVPKRPQNEAEIRFHQLYVTVNPTTDVGVDFAFVDSPFTDFTIERAVTHTIAGYPVKFLTLEDLLIYKVIADRPQDHADVIELLTIHSKVDHRYVRHWLEQFEPLIEKPLLELYHKFCKQAEF